MSQSTGVAWKNRLYMQSSSNDKGVRDNANAILGEIGRLARELEEARRPGGESLREAVKGCLDSIVKSCTDRDGHWIAVKQSAWDLLTQAYRVTPSSTARTTEPVWLWGLLQEMPRDAVIQFAVAMERKLKANDYKGHWGDCSRNYLLGRLKQEANELGRAIYGEKVDVQKVCDEAADVANFAMMLADVCGALPQLPAHASLASSATAGVEPPPGYRTGRRKLVYNKDTKQIDVVDSASGFVVDSFDPPQEVNAADSGAKQ